MVAKQQEKPSYKLGRKFNGSSNRREYSTSTGSMAPDPSLPPVLPRLWEDPTPPPPIRVPILPDNDYARYHRREYVPTVAPPHKPAVLTATLDTSSIDASFKISELLEDVFSQGGEVGKEDEGLIAPRDDDEGEPMTKEKEGVMKTFAVVAAVWWVAGDGVMRALGVI